MLLSTRVARRRSRPVRPPGCATPRGPRPGPDRVVRGQTEDREVDRARFACSSQVSGTARVERPATRTTRQRAAVGRTGRPRRAPHPTRRRALGPAPSGRRRGSARPARARRSRLAPPRTVRRVRARDTIGVFSSRRPLRWRPALAIWSRAPLTSTVGSIPDVDAVGIDERRCRTAYRPRLARLGRERRPPAALGGAPSVRGRAFGSAPTSFSTMFSILLS